MDVTVCIGSSCHIKGSHQIVNRLRQLIDEHGFQNQVSISGTFCMQRCQQGVCVSIDGQDMSVTPQTADDFFHREIVTRI